MNHIKILFFILLFIIATNLNSTFAGENPREKNEASSNTDSKKLKLQTEEDYTSWGDIITTMGYDRTAIKAFSELYTNTPPEKEALKTAKEEAEHFKEIKKDGNKSILISENITKIK